MTRWDMHKIYASFLTVATEAIKIADVQELGDVMIEQLGSLFENKKKLH